ncbi:MAG TPA: aldehyde dehydrogenase [Candidatus Alistipes avicola]|uniref:Aldehyde dehydrogenase n=1 Tax=Candidatus Alistipes avicola TaxID=2838432 RepID=A0A9D2L3H7_9BACT|nr:acyl-CoA reductase [uncultured Alistipes sp.]HJA98663.1 aldehyde dehydrogenase [Candidatus Alistipes avicola]
MKNPIDIFVELGECLQTFGQDPDTRKVIAEACRANEWFTSTEVETAVQAICEEFLDRGKLTDWLARYKRPATLSSRSVLVVMAGNIPLVGFFDLSCVLAAGHRCLVKISAKDTVLMRYVIDLLLQIDPELPLAVYDESTQVQAVIATGSDNANRYFRTQYAGIPALLRGNRHSVAVLSGRETDTQLAALGNDLFSYSGLGCRNVSLLFVPRGYRVKLPSRTMNPKYRHNYLQRRALRRICGQTFADLGFALLIPQSEFPQALSEISLIEYDDLSQVTEWLRVHETQMQCVVSECIEHPRCVPFGRSQHPALGDYPDAVDVMDFLYGL